MVSYKDKDNRGIGSKNDLLQIITLRYVRFQIRIWVKVGSMAWRAGGMDNLRQAMSAVTIKNLFFVCLAFKV